VLSKKAMRPRTIVGDGSSGTGEAMLADQASGCGRFTAKKVFIDPGGKTASFRSQAGLLLLVLEGTAEAASPDGGIAILGSGEALVLAPGEECRLFNQGGEKAVLLKVEGNQ